MDQWDGREVDVCPAWLHWSMLRVSVRCLHYLGEEVEDVVDRDIRVLSSSAGLVDSIITSAGWYPDVQDSQAWNQDLLHLLQI